MPLELFFDLVFVLALTQTSQIMVAEPTWLGLAQAGAVLALMWWAWGAYAWLTSVVDPEAGAVRLAIAGAMAGLVACALCMPEIFTSRSVGLMFAAAYGLVRAMHIVLFVVAGGDAPGLRRSALQIAVPSAVAIGLVVLAVLSSGWVCAALWCVAVALDLAGGLIADPAGWQLHPRHFAERHGLVIIMALGESLVAVAAGAAGHVSPGVVAGAGAAVVISFVLWWLYFDVVSLVSTRRLAEAEPGRVQNTMARDGYSYLHLVMVAGIVLMALGLKKALAHVDEPLALVPATALMGGVALYLAAHVAFRLRHVHTWNVQRTTGAVLLIAAVPVATRIPALASVVALAAAGVVLLLIELRRQGDGRNRVRLAYVGDHSPG